MMSARCQRALSLVAAAAWILFSAMQAHATLAGGEFDFPADSPSARLDTDGQFPFVGAVSVGTGSLFYFGSGVALSPDWVLTAGHNADFNDDGLVDPSWEGAFHLPGFGNYEFAAAHLHPDFTGFASPSVNDDLALMRLATSLPDSLDYPGLGGPVSVDEVLTLVGFGRSGYGSYGYTTLAGFTDRRSGQNAIDSLSLDDEGSGLFEVFRYDFDAPATTGQLGGSLGNDVETIIGPGDSGGPAMVWEGGRWQVVGINTFTQGYGGRFGDVGGGVLIDPYRDWILQTTGLAVPEPASLLLLLAGLIVLTRSGSRQGFR